MEKFPIKKPFHAKGAKRLLLMSEYHLILPMSVSI